MRRLFKVLLSIFAVIIIIVVAFSAIFVLDVVAYTATSSTTLASEGASMGNALVVYNPGLSGTTTRVAEKIAVDLQANGYTVTLAGIKSSAATNTAGYSVIVVGSPIYAGGPTSSVKDFLNGLEGSGFSLGVFGSGQGASTPDDVTMVRDAVPVLQGGGTFSDAVVVKIGETENLDDRASEFVNELVG
jgi:flavodoxin